MLSAAPIVMRNKSDIPLLFEEENEHYKIEEEQKNKSMKSNTNLFESSTGSTSGATAVTLYKFTLNTFKVKVTENWFVRTRSLNSSAVGIPVEGALVGFLDGAIVGAVLGL